MEEKDLNRHDLVFITDKEKLSLKKQLCSKCSGALIKVAGDLFAKEADIPGIVRRGLRNGTEVPVGFVHYWRVEGNRIRVAASIPKEEVKAILRPYQVIQKEFLPRNRCLTAVFGIRKMAIENGIVTGIFGSAAMEIVTELPYTDDRSDLDILVKPAPKNRLEEFYQKVKESYPDIRMDFEVELPNGYGIKLAEIFMDTATVLGKGIKDVRLLNKSQVLQFLK